MTLVLLLPSLLFLSFLPCQSLSSLIDLDPECRLNSHKIGVFHAIQNSVPVVLGWGWKFVASSFWEVRAKASQMSSGGAKGTYGRTQNLYVLRYFVCHFCTQHTWINNKTPNFIHGVEKKVENCWLVLQWHGMYCFQPLCLGFLASSHPHSCIVPQPKSPHWGLKI